MFSIADRTLLRLSATLLFIGELLSLVAGYFHPDHEPANGHHAVFAEYAASTIWTPVHLGQFAGMAVIIAGLFVLFFALNVRTGALGWASRFGAVSAAVTLALYAVLQAVDGVALKQAVDAWASAPDAEKAARFASAETIRWLEWAARSYQSFMLGLAFVLFASRDRLDGAGSAGDRRSDGGVRPGLPRAGLGDRLRGLLGRQFGLRRSSALLAPLRGASGC